MCYSRVILAFGFSNFLSIEIIKSCYKTEQPLQEVFILRCITLELDIAIIIKFLIFIWLKLISHNFPNYISYLTVRRRIILDRPPLQIQINFKKFVYNFATQIKYKTNIKIY